MRLAAYRFDRYRTTEKAEKKPSIRKVIIEADYPKGAAKATAGRVRNGKGAGE